MILPVSHLRDRPANWPLEITPANVSIPATDPLGVSFFNEQLALPRPQLRDNNPAAKSFSEVCWAAIVITGICIVLAASAVFIGFHAGALLVVLARATLGFAGWSRVPDPSPLPGSRPRDSPETLHPTPQLQFDDGAPTTRALGVDSLVRHVMLKTPQQERNVLLQHFTEVLEFGRWIVRPKISRRTIINDDGCKPRIPVPQRASPHAAALAASESPSPPVPGISNLPRAPLAIPTREPATNPSTSSLVATYRQTNAVDSPVNPKTLKRKCEQPSSSTPSVTPATRPPTLGNSAPTTLGVNGLAKQVNPTTPQQERNALLQHIAEVLESQLRPTTPSRPRTRSASGAFLLASPSAPVSCDDPFLYEPSTVGEPEAGEERPPTDTTLERLIYQALNDLEGRYAPEAPSSSASTSSEDEDADPPRLSVLQRARAFEQLAGTASDAASTLEDAAIGVRVGRVKSIVAQWTRECPGRVASEDWQRLQPEEELVSGVAVPSGQLRSLDSILGEV
ncbi:hypothetical protein DFH07DRAFT_936566 [Mycena maculata]|uniref:Uncharacterized protein n=1 Tax=Mycena maculata TaxID=230809 RepID=A0AAD7NWI9_9AGAR|nr:hypothetical protein DFH07DRAFT_936566 [Mycena maculata]